MNAFTLVVYHYLVNKSCVACIAAHLTTVETEDWSSKTNLAQNRGGRPATNESWTSDREATCSGSIGLAETCGNGYVVSDTPPKRKRESIYYLCQEILRSVMFVCLFVGEFVR